MSTRGRILTPEEDDAVAAIADLGNRCGAREFQIGYLHDDGPAEDAGWYAHVAFRGARITVDNQPGPAQAALALAERILTGAKCRCGKLVALSDDGATIHDGQQMVDGTTWTIEQARAAGQCRWRLVGARWEPSCPAPKVPMKLARRFR